MPLWWLICDPWCSCTIILCIATISHANMVAYLQSVVQLHHYSLYSHHFTGQYGGLFAIRGAAAPLFFI